jgi:hypothetical protein
MSATGVVGFLISWSAVAILVGAAYWIFSLGA